MIPMCLSTFDKASGLDRIGILPVTESEEVRHETRCSSSSNIGVSLSSEFGSRISTFGYRNSRTGVIEEVAELPIFPSVSVH